MREPDSGLSVVVFCVRRRSIVAVSAALRTSASIFPPARICRGEALSVVLKSPPEKRNVHQEAPGRSCVHQQPNMVTQPRVQLHTLLLLLLVVPLGQPVCVDVPSETEAVLGKSMMLTCIFCMKREEVKSKTRVDWYYMPTNEKDILKTHIYKYEKDVPSPLDGPFMGRLTWNGSLDLQEVSIQIHNVTFNDSGIYECHVMREFGYFTPPLYVMKNITLKVKAKATNDAAALYSEIMMYVLLVFLTLWLLVEMVYCYRKISKSDEQAQDTATTYLAVPSEQKDNAPAPVAE